MDNKKEVRVIFLDIAKVFDKVWYRGILHKLQKAGIDGNLLFWFVVWFKSLKSGY